MQVQQSRKLTWGDAAARADLVDSGAKDAYASLWSLRVMNFPKHSARQPAFLERL